MSHATPMKRIYVFKRYERFWHWSQAVLVIVMLVTGFEIHGSYDKLGFERAVRLHALSAWTLLALWAFTIFWQFTTGEWRQYIPTANKLVAMARYYMFGIFVGAPHPYHVTARKKHNPLQRLAYLALLALVSPIIWGSGLLYLFYRWETCVREATVLGLLNIPSLGLLIEDSKSRMRQDDLLFYVLVAAALVLVGDLVSSWLRHLVRRAS